MKKHITFFAILAFFALPISAQTFLQKGIVVDESGDPLIGVSIQVKETTDATITDVDGNFSITVAEKAVLVISYIGFERQEYNVNPSKEFIKITLRESHMMLEEAVIIGYGVTKKSSLTGSVITIRGKSSKSGKSVKRKDVPVLDKDKVGRLTAGELNDFSKWMMWDSIANKVLSTHKTTWKIEPLQRYVAQLTNKQGMPIVNAKVILTDSANREIWQTRTDNTGRAELWENIFTTTNEKATSIYFEYSGENISIAATPFTQGINAAVLDVACNTTKNVDIMMIVDATGSMGDEITYLQNELHDIINKIKAKQSDLDIEFGSVFYRDKGDQYLTRKSSLDKDIDQTISFIKEQRASGGGDYPEAVDEALYQAIEMENWRDDALTRIAFIVLDAPAHNTTESIDKIHAQIRIAAQKGIRIIPIVCSGTDKSCEYLMRSMALATNGTYIFLTDDSGIGDAHIKPSTDKYDVESLNDLIIRLVLQYTQMPDCNNSKWVNEYKKEQASDKFVPNPSDQDPEKSVSKLSVDKVMKVYPNPCSDVLKIDIKQDVKDLCLVDMSGKLLLKLNAQKGETTEVNVSGYSSGVYFVKAYYKGRWFAEKIIVRQ